MVQKILKYLKYAGITLVVLALVGYIIYAMISLSAPDPDERCIGVELIIDDTRQTNFITTNDIETTLKSKHIYPQGQLMSKIDTRKIEDLIRENSFVDNVQCYKTAKGNLCIKVTQRIPVMYIIPAAGDAYYIDKGGNIIPSQEYSAGIPIATGNIKREYAAKQLADFGMYVISDEFWNNQIEQIHVLSSKGGEPEVEIIPRVGNHVILLGPLTDYDKKLRRLRIFYDKAIGIVGWNKYERISLKYRNQIICTKR